MSARAKAKATGEKLYWTGKPCPRGHVAMRYTSNGTCEACLKGEVREKVESGYFRQHYAKNSERILARCKRYVQANRERVIARSAGWAKRNPEKRRAISSNYKHRRRSLEAKGISSGVLSAWEGEQPKVCFYCSAECSGSYHVDHFIPLARGGAHVLTNLRIACAPCNLSKSARDPMEWMDMIQPVTEEAA